MNFTIINIREIPSFAAKAAAWFSSKWGIGREIYEESFRGMLNGRGPLPRWYIAVDQRGAIAGGCGLITNDFCHRTDLSPYLCGLFVEPWARGNELGAALLTHVRLEAYRNGFQKLYLCTDHTAFYEKYGWRHIGIGEHPDGSSSRLYEADAIAPFESMSDFFTSRIDIYDDHMLQEVEGCKAGYRMMASLVPKNTKRLLDLGCGTGLELEEIFKMLPDVRVTGIDLTQSMLDRLKEKYGDRDIHLICGSYFDADLGSECYECAVSFQTMHHFTREKKVDLYKKIYRALKVGGVYIECDYMVESEAEETFYFTENVRVRRDLGIPNDAYYHFDTPCTVRHQLEMFQEAGFPEPVQVWREENTVMIVAKREG